MQKIILPKKHEIAYVKSLLNMLLREKIFIIIWLVMLNLNGIIYLYFGHELLNLFLTGYFVGGAIDMIFNYFKIKFFISMALKDFKLLFKITRFLDVFIEDEKRT